VRHDSFIVFHMIVFILHIFVYIYVFTYNIYIYIYIYIHIFISIRATWFNHCRFHECSFSWMQTARTLDPWLIWNDSIIFIYIYVYMFSCMYWICIYVYMYLYMNIWICIHLYICVWCDSSIVVPINLHSPHLESMAPVTWLIHAYEHIHTHLEIYVFISNIHVHEYVFTYVNIHIHICIYLYSYVRHDSFIVDPMNTNSLHLGSIPRVTWLTHIYEHIHIYIYIDV